MQTSSDFSPTSKPVIAGAVTALILAVVGLIVVPPSVHKIFSSSFLPHAYCYLYDRQLIALHAGSDAVIWLSYLAISCSLVYLVWSTRREIPFSWMFLAFGLFIVACGFTHFMEIVVLWKPLYWLAGDVKLLTALASIVTAIALPGLLPRVRAMVGAAQLSEARRLQIERANLELQKLSASVMNVQDAERRRIARELHDSVGQYLAAIKMSSEMALAESTPAAGSALQNSLQLLDHCTREVRTMSYLLHPPLLEEIGLASAIPWYVDGFAERSGIKVDVDLQPEVERLPQPVELALFRLLQESMTNIHRHSGSKVAKVSFRIIDGRATLTIEDRGRGFNTGNGSASPAGVGLIGMRERVHELGGELKVTSGSGGTIIQASVPLHQQSPSPHELAARFESPA